MMSHDEFRVCNFDESCEKQQKTPGELLAENIKYCRKLLQPQVAYVWNDMFDPYPQRGEGPVLPRQRSVDRLVGRAGPRTS